ncbi:hypothetical protein EPN29_13525 [bacterium]|nr:MAG: hypothetical protein EPN29_13525 [bacterium]
MTLQIEELTPAVLKEEASRARAVAAVAREVERHRFLTPDQLHRIADLHEQLAGELEGIAASRTVR